jgi:3-oxoacyl-[acyl-carrier protein] reductase
MTSALQGKVALVTGASMGIGNAIAEALAQEGAHVLCSARNADRLEDLVRKLAGRGLRATAVVMDVRSEVSVRRELDALASRFSALDVLVNNAGGAPRFGGFAELGDADWLDAYELNVMGPVRVIRSALPLLQKSPAPRIINLSSVSGLQPGSYNPHYAAAKSALINVGKHLADLLARHRILVTTVCPGPVHSDAWDRNVERVARARGIDIEAARAAVEREEAAKVPLGRVGDAQEVAALVAFLAGGGASYMTGTCIVVDGGKYRAAF